MSQEDAKQMGRLAKSGLGVAILTLVAVAEAEHAACPRRAPICAPSSFPPPAFSPSHSRPGMCASFNGRQRSCSRRTKDQSSSCVDVAAARRSAPAGFVTHICRITKCSKREEMTDEGCDPINSSEPNGRVKCTSHGCCVAGRHIAQELRVESVE